MTYMDISVIVCTYNRAASLAVALESIVSQRLPDSVAWELVVVDNNSTDRTREVVEEISGRNGSRVVYAHESKRGKSNALNKGIAIARGDVFAFTDDDVIVEPGWLEKLTRTLCAGQYAGAGGRTLGERGYSAPPWLKGDGYYTLAPLALFDRGLEASDLPDAPYGNNMAFRREMFAKYGAFRTDLGPQPGSEIRDEDTEFGCRVLAGGERVRYEPAAVVYHAVPAARVTQSYFLKWWFDKARADVRQHGVAADTRWRVAGAPAYLYRRLLRWAIQWLLSVTPSHRFWCKSRVWWVAGSIYECRHASESHLASISAHGSQVGRSS